MHIDLKALLNRLEKVVEATDHDIQEVQSWAQDARERNNCWKLDVEATLKEQQQETKGVRKYLKRVSEYLHGK